MKPVSTTRSIFPIASVNPMASAPAILPETLPEMDKARTARVESEKNFNARRRAEIFLRKSTRQGMDRHAHDRARDDAWLRLDCWGEGKGSENASLRGAQRRSNPAVKACPGRYPSGFIDILIAFRPSFDRTNHPTEKSPCHSSTNLSQN